MDDKDADEAPKYTITKKGNNYRIEGPGLSTAWDCPGPGPEVAEATVKWLQDTEAIEIEPVKPAKIAKINPTSVSYTHLTLPTICSV